MSGRCIGSDEKVMGVLEVSVNGDGVFEGASFQILFMKGALEFNNVFQTSNAALNQEAEIIEICNTKFTLNHHWRPNILAEKVDAKPDNCPGPEESTIETFYMNYKTSQLRIKI